MDDQILVVEKSPMICRFVERHPWEQSANLWQAPLPHFKSWTSGQLSILLIQHLVNFSNNVMKSARSHDVRYFAIFLHCPREFPIFLVFTPLRPHLKSFLKSSSSLDILDPRTLLLRDVKQLPHSHKLHVLCIYLL